ncbi:MAG: hypothetical protein Q4P72_00505 [Eubacteriales bacterium]|nr:hypothetical protein [Eubacteriales bacterium]
MSDFLVREIFKKEALRLSPEGEAFWYTSGTFGPFYINTHFLAGGEQRAKAALALIEESLAAETPKLSEISDYFAKLEAEDADFRHCIDLAEAKIRELLNNEQVSHISGGERRDFFFSFPLARRFQVPHLTLRKTGELYLSQADGSAIVEKANLSGARILHVADIITLASSFFDRWIPAIEAGGAKISYAFAILDRRQGGLQRLQKAGIETAVLETCNEDFFQLASSVGSISNVDAEMALHFIDDAKSYEAAFLKQHPDFLQRSIEAGGSQAERAQNYLRTHAASED